MYDYKIVRYMAGESMKKMTLVSLRDGYVIKTNPVDCMTIGILTKDCFKGEMVEIIIVGEAIAES